MDPDALLAVGGRIAIRKQLVQHQIGYVVSLLCSGCDGPEVLLCLYTHFSIELKVALPLRRRRIGAGELLKQSGKLRFIAVHKFLLSAIPLGELSVPKFHAIPETARLNAVE